MTTSLTAPHLRSHPQPLLRPQRFQRVRAIVRLLPLLLVLLTFLPGQQVRASAPSAELPPGCFELVLNGGFEQVNSVWFVPPSLNPGVYDNSQSFAGNYSMRLGNIDAPNVSSQSRVEQTINLPANANSIVLSFRYYGRIDGNPVGSDDRQYLDVYDAGANQFLARLFEARNNDRIWLGAQYSMTAYRGRQIRLSFGTDNDGVDARIAMNLDEVSVFYCTTTPTATPTPTPTPTPTFFPTFVPTFVPTFFPTFQPPTPTFTPVPGMPGGCTDLMVNGSFEGNGGWEFGASPIPGQVLTTFPQQGARLVQLGNPPGFRTDTHSFSSVRQLVTIPANAGSVQLRWFHWYGTQEAPSDAIAVGADRQELILLNPDLSTLAVVNRTRRNDSGWAQEVTDLTAWRGRTLYIYFNAFNDGNGSRTWMYLDTVLLCAFQGIQPLPMPVSGTANPQPYIAPTVTFMPTQFVPGSTPFPTVFIPPTQTPTPTEYANPAPLGVATFQPGPDVAPGEVTPDMGAPTADPFSQLAQSDVAAGGGTTTVIPGATEDAAGSQEPAPTRRLGVVAAMCGIVLVIALLGVGIIRAISGSRGNNVP